MEVLNIVAKIKNNFKSNSLFIKNILFLSSIAKEYKISNKIIKEISFINKKWRRLEDG